MKDRLQGEIESLGPWFHNLHLPDGAQTVPRHPLGDFPGFKWKMIAPFIPENLEGWSVLDIGCNAGFYCFELAKRGANVVGIDLDAHYLRQARWAAAQFELEDQIEFRQMQVYDLAHTDEQFDLIVFMGVFYHLRYPTLALDIVSQKVKRLMLFQSLSMVGDEVYETPGDMGLQDRELMREPGWPKMAFIEHNFMGDPTNWWAPNHACVEALMRASGMKILHRPERETYLCEPDPENPSCVSTWAAGELLSATGRAL